MFLHVFKKSKNLLRLAVILLFLSIAPSSRAAGSAESSLFSNPLTIGMIALMSLLVIVIGILANVLLGAADIKWRKEKNKSKTGIVTAMLMFMLLASASLFAQTATPVSDATTTTSNNFGGMSSSVFYIMASVIFLELLIIIVMLFSIRHLINVERARVSGAPLALTEEEKRTRLTWWDRFNNLKPVAQEAELDLGHDYDGIRELNNRLPPWWLYGFYITIIVAGVYLWRYHVSHSGPSSKEEFETDVTNANAEVAQYLKLKGDNVDENTVTLLKDQADLDAGKAIFNNPQNCVTCHRADGGGVVGPNLTDDYWLYGGTIKDLFKTIKYGTSKGMRSWKDDLSSKQIAQVASYVKSLHGTNPPNPKPPQGDLFKEAAGASDSTKVVKDSATLKTPK